MQARETLGPMFLDAIVLSVAFLSMEFVRSGGLGGRGVGYPAILLSSPPGTRFGYSFRITLPNRSYDHDICKLIDYSSAHMSRLSKEEASV